MTKFSTSLRRQSALSLLIVVCGFTSVSKADEKKLQTHENVHMMGIYGASVSVKAVDNAQQTLELSWPFRSAEPTEYTPSQLVVTQTTQFKIWQKCVTISDIKVGDTLQEIRNNNIDGKVDNAYFWANSLVVTSLQPLTLTIHGGSGGSSPTLKPKPGQTISDSLVESLQADEFRGIGHYFPHRSWRDADGKLKKSTTFIVPQPEPMIFTRSVASKPLKMSDFSVGQSLVIDGTMRPDGKLVATTIWSVEEKSPTSTP